MTSSFSSRVAGSKILLKSTPECLFGWSYIILKLHDAAPHWDLLLLWTPTAGEIICHFNLWCNYSKETSLRSSLIVIDRHWVLWTPTAGEIICHFNLWCNHSKETSLRSSLIVIDRHWVLWTPTAGEIIYHFNFWCNHSKETSLRLSLIVIDRHWSSLIVIESSELLQRARFIVTSICGGPHGVTIQNKPLWLNVCTVQSNRV